MKRIILSSALGLLSLSALADDSIANGSFESSNVSLGGYLYAGSVVASDWNFLNGAGISSNGTAWGGIAANGNYFAFLQNSASITQSFVLSTAANLSFAFDLAQRSAWNSGGAQTVTLSLDGQQIASFTPLNTQGWDVWATLGASVSNVAAGAHTLSFTGTNPLNATDTAAFLDNVQLSVTAVPEPSSLAMLLGGLGLIGMMVRRRTA